MAQKLALLVSEEKLKAFTSINQNVSPADLIPYILQSQDIVLQNYIGATYYMELKNQVVTGTVSSNNQFLLDNYIGNALCNWGLFYALPFLKYKIFNKSVVSPTSESSESITLEELKFLMEQVRSAGETYMKRMIEWMVLHPGDYQAYVAPRVLDGQLPERGNPYFGSLVTPKQPYAWKKRTLVGTRDASNVGWYGGVEGCEPFGMNFYQAPGSGN
jgi:hypothetical protein